jgi:hypothetical protein
MWLINELGNRDILRGFIFREFYAIIEVRECLKTGIIFYDRPKTHSQYRNYCPCRPR